MIGLARSIRALRVGTITVDSGLIAPEERGNWGPTIELPVWVFLIEAGDGALVLVDTGPHIDHAKCRHLHFADDARRSRLISCTVDPSVAIQVALARIGVDVHDVTHVINTHLHFDHAGNNWQFLRATFWVQRDHFREAAENPFYDTKPMTWRHPDLRYELLDGDHDLFPGVSVLDTSGHVPGHQSVLVRLGSADEKVGRVGGRLTLSTESKMRRAVMLAGDAIFVGANLKNGHWQGNEVGRDTAALKASVEKLLELARREDAMLVFGHDRRVEQLEELSGSIVT